MKHKKSALMQSVIALLLCISMLVGTTFAWFTDSVTTGINTIAAGNLDVALYHSNAAVTDEQVDSNTMLFMDLQGKPILWEPGVVSYENLRVANEGDLALIYQLAIATENENFVQDPSGAAYGLSQILKVGVVEGGITATDRAGVVASVDAANWTTLASFLRSGSLLPEGTGESEKTWGVVIYWEPGVNDNLWNLNNGKQLDQGEYLMIDLGVRLIATQEQYENDSFGSDYDTNAKADVFPDFVGGTASTPVTPNDQNQTAADVSLNAGKVSAIVPAGVQLADGASELTLSVTEMNGTGANIQLGENEAMRSLDVHIEGVAANNAAPITVTLKEVAPTGLNMGNYKLYHVENGATNEMILVDSAADFTAHNQFKYDPATGDIVLYMATFSEVAVVAHTVNPWNGDIADAFSGGSGTTADPYLIANADQLAYLNDLVSNGEDVSKDKHYKLIADINFGGSSNSHIWYPIGYWAKGEGTNKAGEETWYTYGDAFQGVFDGAGHKISGIYQNTWAMDGNYDNGYWKEAMGLFGYVYGGTVKNLTVDNFKSEGEFAPTGVVAAYAANATFENIAITNSHPATYNTSVAAVVGRDGKIGLNENDGYNLIFKNITVDRTNTVSALWGSWDVGAAGLLGYLGSDSKVLFENCNVAATIDVYNDVCGNYQYYWYRYCGAFIGTVDKRLDNGKGALDLSNVTAKNCTVDFGDRHEYYYCEFEKNTQASYTEDFQFSRVDHSELNMDSNPVTCKHTHTTNEDKQAVYLPFRQLFGGYGWGVDGVDLGEYDNIEISQVTSAQEKFATKFTGNFLYRVGNKNMVSLSSLFGAKDGVKINNSGVYVTIDKVDENSNVNGTFKADTSDWTKGTIQFSGTGVVKVTIQDYDYCTPTELIVEVIDATNLTSATGTTTGGNFVLLCDVNTSTYVNYWNCTLYGNGFTYSLKDAPTAYNSKQGHGILITKNATLDNLVIVGDIYNSYGAYTNQDYYNTAIDVVGDTTIQNCYIANCAAPVKARSNVTIKNTTLHGGAVANLLIMSGTATLENVTTANYDDGREMVGMGIVIHSDATESAKLVLNGTLTQYNFISEAKKPTDTYAVNLHNTMFGSSCSEYHFGTSPNRYVNTGIISLTALFNAEDITDNANTGYVGTAVTVSGVNGYVYTQPNTTGSVNNDYDPNADTNVGSTQGAVPPSYSFDYTTKNYVAKTDGSNDYCYAENGKVYISMDDGDTFNWDTSILSVQKEGKDLTYTVSMNGIDYTGKSIAFNTAGDYTVEYTYTDPYNYNSGEDGNITTYSKTYTKTVAISVAVVEAATKHAEFTFGSSNTAATTVTVGNNTYVMPNVSATSSTIGSTTVSGKTIYYPIVEIVMSDGKTSHTSGWYAYFPVFSGAVTITDYKDNGLGDAETFGSSTQSMPSGLSIVGDPAQLFKYQSSSTAGTSPVVKNNILVYSSPSISAKRSEYNTVIQYSYQDNAGTTYYYYIGYHAPAQSYTSCVTADTLVTLADGTQKRIDQVTYEDQLLVWDFDKGEYTYANSSIIENHGYDMNDIIQLTFEDGTAIKVVNVHGFFDADLNKWVDINATNATDYIGHSFTQVDGNGYKTVKLVSVESSVEYVEAWSVLSAGYYNCVLEGMFSITPPATEQLAFFEIGSDMKYDAKSKQADIEKYGLYTYEEMAHLMTEEQFEAFCFAEIKVAVGKGLITFDELLALLATYA